MVKCEVEDNFDDSYEAFCPLSKTLNAYHNSHLNQAVVQNNAKVVSHHTHKMSRQDVSPCSCFALSITLDYEHFDAFSEFDYNYRRPALNHIVVDSTETGQKCRVKKKEKFIHLFNKQHDSTRTKATHLQIRTDRNKRDFQLLFCFDS